MNWELQLRYAEAIRTMLNAETTNVAARMNWMILLQGLLFAAASQFANASQLPHRSAVITVLALLGIGVSIAMRHEFRFSERAIAELLQRWDAFKATCSPEQLAVMPPAFAGGRVEASWWDRLIASRRSWPFLFLVSWAALSVLLIGA